MMNHKTLVILGNGFDLDLGLSTSFKSFVDSFLFKTAPEAPLIKDIKINHWSDLERVFRIKILEYIENPTDSLCENIKDTWNIIQNRWSRYLPEITELRNIEVCIKKNSCAYQLMQKAKNTSNWYSFNYTDPFYLSGISENMFPIYIHGSFQPREFLEKDLMFPIPNNLIIGIDSDISLSKIDNENIRHILKKQHRAYKETNILKSLKESHNIILFGHSLAITDSDYFKSFFSSIINGKLKPKKIFIVTYNSISLQEIKANMKEYSIDYNELFSSNVEIIPIFTVNGSNDHDFRKMLNYID